ncbi:hypothetical protein PR048_002686 [Dryococelus australis]|uniref:Uncharacterized protein n=1 Tax=Dryococelus australis TaxID=614101 RepID=A0ABQ9IMD4_9NEOP|nr:hypothetical protein PR048_002686 [Dryococelus australis]
MANLLTCEQPSVLPALSVLRDRLPTQSSFSRTFPWIHRCMYLQRCKTAWLRHNNSSNCARSENDSAQGRSHSIRWRSKDSGRPVGDVVAGAKESGNASNVTAGTTSDKADGEKPLAGNIHSTLTRSSYGPSSHANVHFEHRRKLDRRIGTGDNQLAVMHVAAPWSSRSKPGRKLSLLDKYPTRSEIKPNKPPGQPKYQGLYLVGQVKIWVYRRNGDAFGRSCVGNYDVEIWQENFSELAPCWAPGDTFWSRLKVFFCCIAFVCDACEEVKVSRWSGVEVRGVPPPRNPVATSWCLGHVTFPDIKWKITFHRLADPRMIPARVSSLSPPQVSITRLEHYALQRRIWLQYFMHLVIHTRVVLGRQYRDICYTDTLYRTGYVGNYTFEDMYRGHERPACSKPDTEILMRNAFRLYSGSDKDSGRPVGDAGAGAKEAYNASNGVLNTSVEKFDICIEDFVDIITEEVVGTVASVHDRAAGSDVGVTAAEIDGTPLQLKKSMARNHWANPLRLKERELHAKEAGMAAVRDWVAMASRYNQGKLIETIRFSARLLQSLLSLPRRLETACKTKKISADIRQYFKSPSPATQEAAPLQELGQSCTPTDTSGNSECDDACTSQTSALVENLEDKDTDYLGTLESGSMQPKLTDERSSSQVDLMNGKKLTEALKSHDSSQNHNKCFEKYVAYKLMSKIVADLLITRKKQQQEATHEYMKKLCDIIFCVWVGKGSTFEVIGKIHNELIETAATVTKEEISNSIHNSGMFSIIVDEARCFKEEQMSIFLRYPENLHPQEKFIGFVNCSKARDSTSLAAAVTDVLNNLHIEGMVMVAQSYYGASVMSCQYPQATYIHCMAHRVNLVITDASSLALTVNFWKYRNCSDSRLRNSAGGTASTKSVAISLQISKLLFRLCLKREEGKDQDVVTAMGIISSIKTPNFIVCLFTMDYVLSPMNVLSNYFQKEEATLGASERLVKSTLATLKEKRDKFDDVWIPIEKFAEEHDLTLSAPKASKKRKLNTSHSLQDYIVESTLEQTMTAVDGETIDKEYSCCHVYYAVFDSIMVNLEKPFYTLEFAEVSVFKNFLKTKKILLEQREVFSAMRRVKTWLQSTTGQERFSSLSLTHIEAALLKKIGIPEKTCLPAAFSLAKIWGRIHRELNPVRLGGYIVPSKHKLSANCRPDTCTVGNCRFNARRQPSDNGGMSFFETECLPLEKRQWPTIFFRITNGYHRQYVGMISQSKHVASILKMFVGRFPYGTFVVSARHRNDTQPSRARYRSDIQPSQAQHRNDIQTSQARHRIGCSRDIQSLQTWHRSDIRPPQTWHRNDIQSQARYHRDIQPSQARHHRDIQPSQAQNRNDIQPLQAWHRSDIQPKPRHHRDIQPSQARRLRDIQPSQARHRSDTQPSQARHHRDIQPSQAQHRKDIQPSQAEHRSDIQPSQTRNRNDIQPP